MSRSTGKRESERRRHPRLPVVEGLVEPITLRYAPDASADAARPSRGGPSPAARGGLPSQPAILTNLSAGGMSLITFVEPPHARTLAMDLSLPGLEHVKIEAKVVRVLSKGQTYNVGIQFTKISAKSQKQINDVASDHLDCETRIALALPEACVPHCSFHRLCQKPQKAPHWPPKA